MLSSPPEPAAVVLMERSEQHGDRLAVHIYAQGSKLSDLIQETEILLIKITARQDTYTDITVCEIRRIIEEIIPAQREIRHMR